MNLRWNRWFTKKPPGQKKGSATTDSDGQKLYELADRDHHDHIVCLDCQNIFEFHDEEIEKRQESVCRKLRFSPKGHRHVIYASCEYLQCKK